jgi:xanthine/uracil permease
MAFEWFFNFVSYENIEVVSIALGVLVFVVAYDLMKRMMDQKMSFIVCLIIGVMLAWRVYSALSADGTHAFAISLSSVTMTSHCSSCAYIPASGSKSGWSCFRERSRLRSSV